MNSVSNLDIGDLFARAFARWKERVWTLLGSMLILMAALLGALLPLGAIVLAAKLGGLSDLAVGILALALVLGLYLPFLIWGAGWYGASYYALVMDDSLKLGDAFKLGRSHAWRIQGALIFSASAIFVGCLFCLLPGLALVPLLAFVPFAYLDGFEGIEASQKSYELARPQYWTVLLLVYLAYLVPAAGSVIPVLGIVIRIALAPFTALLLHEIYKDLGGPKKSPLKTDRSQAQLILYGSIIFLILISGLAGGLTAFYWDQIFPAFQKLASTHH